MGASECKREDWRSISGHAKTSCRDKQQQILSTMMKNKKLTPCTPFSHSSWVCACSSFYEARTAPPSAVLRPTPRLHVLSVLRLDYRSSRLLVLTALSPRLGCRYWLHIIRCFHFDTLCRKCAVRICFGPSLSVNRGVKNVATGLGLNFGYIGHFDPSTLKSQVRFEAKWSGTFLKEIKSQHYMYQTSVV